MISCPMSEQKHSGPAKGGKGNDIYVSEVEVREKGMDGRKLVAVRRIHYSKSPSLERMKGLSNIYKVATMCFCLLQTASVQIPVHAGLIQRS